ncbi:effector binding domain-containing protein [Carnobacterium gallinarum]|uniref:effector binding domain-containing protein n=1 Tax=Carnobacterium gallinarum TaxID=2749 RepID=UPI00068CA07B|nr:effector binding domain-containing protein [Carnobacterium gallinarum]
MSFTVKEFSAHYIIGSSTPIDIPQDPSGFPAISANKEKALTELKKNQKELAEFASDAHFYGVNANLDGAHYIVGVKAEKAVSGQASFELPAGEYAVLTTSVTTRLEADQFIGAAYGEVYQSEDYAINGNYNLEIVDAFIQDQVTEFSVLIPVVKK